MIGQDKATSVDGKTGAIPRVISGKGTPAEEPAEEPALAESALPNTEESPWDAMRVAKGALSSFATKYNLEPKWLRTYT